MASESTAFRRIVLRSLYVVLTMLALVLALGGWVLGTTSGARAAFSLLETLSRHTLKAGTVEGRLIGPMRIDSLVLDQTGNRIALKDIRFNWQPWDLRQGVLHIEMLHIAGMDVESKPEQPSKPPALPDSLALPIKLRADDVRLEKGTFRRGSDTLATVGPLALAAEYDGNRYNLRLARLSVTAANNTVMVDASGQANLGARKPFPLEARITSESRAKIEEHALAAAGSLHLGGSLEQMLATVDLAVGDAKVNGKATVLPFATAPLGPAQLSVEQLDPARFDARLPHALLSLQLSVADDGKGELHLANSHAGRYDEGKLPLSNLTVDFRQDQGGYLFDQILARLGPAGDLTGNGSLRDGALSLVLRTDSLDLKRVDGRVRKTQLSGDAELLHRNGRQTFRINLSEPMQQQRLTLTAEGEHSGEEVALRKATLQAGSGRAEFSGRVGLGGKQAFDAEGKIAHLRLRDIGKFPQAPDFDLNGSFSLHGMRQPQLEADLAFRITDSSLAGQPLTGDGTLVLSQEKLSIPRFFIASGTNRLNMEGELSDGAAQIAFLLDAQQLGQLGPSFGGSLQANGTVRGTLAKPHVVASWSAANARMPGGVQIEAMQGEADLALDRERPLMLDAGTGNLRARGLRYGEEKLTSATAALRFAPRPDAPLSVNLLIEGIDSTKLRAQRFQATANGTTANHSIDIALDETGQTWAAKASGGLAIAPDDTRWQGAINTFDARGRFNARLASPAQVLLSAARVQVDSLRLQADGAQVTVERFARDASGIVTSGRIDSLQLTPLLALASVPPPVRTDLELSGEWNLRLTDSLSGTLALRRERGDVTVLTGSPVTLGLRALSANVNADAGRVTLQLQADGRQLGTIAMNAATTLGDASNKLAIAPDAGVSGNIRIDVPSLAWVAPLVSPTLSAGGRLQSDVQLGGSIAQPQLTGRIAGSSLRIAMADLGVDLRDGTLDAEFQGERLMIRNLTFAGSEGTVGLSGPVDLGGGTVAARLALQANRFAVLNRVDRRFVASGNSTLDWQGRSGKLAGAFTINSGFVDLGRADKPTLSDDVVVVGKEKKASGGSTLAMDVTIALGDGVTLKGRGLDGRLEGQVRVTSEHGESLRADGTLSIAKGSYTAYGRELTIERGLLRFRGPANNPSLDILAMRRGQEVEAGVSIGGTALTPRVTLVSDPNVPDAEKLSWLVLGRGLSTAGETDLGALQSAAGALLSEGAKAGVQSRIASAFGLDTFSIGTSQDSLQQRVVTVGKQISSRLYLSYQQGLDTAGSVVQLRYTLSSKLSLEAETGSRSALSLFYNIAFD